MEDEIQASLDALKQKWQQWRDSLQFNNELQEWWKYHPEIKDIVEALTLFEYEDLKTRNAAAALSKLNLPKKYREKSFSNYQPKTESQRQALKICISFSCQEYGKNNLYFSGLTGVGKTHLACATLISQVKVHGINGYFCQLSPLLTRYKNSIFERMNSYSDFSNGVHEFDLAKYAEILLIDDFGAENNSEWMWEKIFELIDFRASNDLPTLFTSNFEIGIFMRSANLNAVRIASRLFEVCHEIKITGPNWRKEKERDEKKIQ